MISLARRITIGTVAMTVVVVGLSAAMVWMVARWQELRVLDGQLAEHADRFAFMAQHGVPMLHGGGPDGADRGHGHGDRDKPAPPSLQAGSGWVFLEIFDRDAGTSVFRSESFPDASSSLLPAVRQAAAGAVVWAELGGRRVRATRVDAVEQRRFREPPAPDGWDWLVGPGEERVQTRNLTACFAVDATQAETGLRRLALTLGAVWLTASVLALITAWWLRRSVIGPLRRLGAGIREIDPEHPAGRVRADVPVEMSETIALLNGLLDRLAGVLEREKGTIANIAHELRSPISGLRTTLEVAALDPHCGGQALVARCLPTVVAMHAMVANLLALARLEAGREPVETRPVDVAELVAACWSVARPLADGRSQRLVSTGAGGTALTCPDKARIVLANLIDNAVTHAPPGSEIGCDCDLADGWVVVRVANPIAGPEPDLARVFEPFWRGDGARTSPQHCGLGLALAKRLANLLGAELQVAIDGGRFVSILRLPRAAGRP